MKYVYYLSILVLSAHLFSGHLYAPVPRYDLDGTERSNHGGDAPDGYFAVRYGCNIFYLKYTSEEDAQSNTTQSAAAEPQTIFNTLKVDEDPTPLDLLLEGKMSIPPDEAE